MARTNMDSELGTDLSLEHDLDMHMDLSSEIKEEILKDNPTEEENKAKDDFVTYHPVDGYKEENKSVSYHEKNNDFVTYHSINEYKQESDYVPCQEFKEEDSCQTDGYIKNEDFVIYPINDLKEEDGSPIDRFIGDDDYVTYHQIDGFKEENDNNTHYQSENENNLNTNFQINENNKDGFVTYNKIDVVEDIKIEEPALELSILDSKNSINSITRNISKNVTTSNSINRQLKVIQPSTTGTISPKITPTPLNRQLKVIQPSTTRAICPKITSTPLNRQLKVIQPSTARTISPKITTSTPLNGQLKVIQPSTTRTISPKITTSTPLNRQLKLLKTSTSFKESSSTKITTSPVNIAPKPNANNPSNKKIAKPSTDNSFDRKISKPSANNLSNKSIPKPSADDFCNKNMAKQSADNNYNHTVIRVNTGLKVPVVTITKPCSLIQSSCAPIDENNSTVSTIKSEHLLATSLSKSGKDIQTSSLPYYISTINGKIILFMPVNSLTKPDTMIQSRCEPTDKPNDIDTIVQTRSSPVDSSNDVELPKHIVNNPKNKASSSVKKKCLKSKCNLKNSKIFKKTNQNLVNSTCLPCKHMQIAWLGATKNLKSTFSFVGKKRIIKKYKHCCRKILKRIILKLRGKNCISNDELNNLEIRSNFFQTLMPNGLRYFCKDCYKFSTERVDNKPIDWDYKGFTEEETNYSLIYHMIQHLSTEEHELNTKNVAHMSLDEIEHKIKENFCKAALFRAQNYGVNHDYFQLYDLVHKIGLNLDFKFIHPLGNAFKKEIELAQAYDACFFVLQQHKKAMFSQISPITLMKPKVTISIDKYTTTRFKNITRQIIVSTHIGKDGLLTNTLLLTSWPVNNFPQDSVPQLIEKSKAIIKDIEKIVAISCLENIVKPILENIPELNKNLFYVPDFSSKLKLLLLLSNRIGF